MASEEAEEHAVIVEAVAARARELVRALLVPGGLLSVEDAGEAVANGVRSGAENLAVRSQDVEKLAVAAAVAALSVLVISGVGSLSTPHGVVEEEITKAVAAAATQVRDMNTSSDYSVHFWFVVGKFFLCVTILAMGLFWFTTQVIDMNTSSDYSFDFWLMVVTFFLWVTTLALGLFGDMI